MRFVVDWETTYRYSEPVRLLHSELRVMPAARFGQQVLDAKLSVEPRARMASQTDAFGNTFHYFDLLGIVEQIHIGLTAEVETPPDGIREECVVGPLERHLMLMETHRCPLDRRIGEFAKAAGAADDPLAFADRLLELFATRFRFEVGRTSVEDTALDLLNLEHGVCQDFAHLMLAGLRLAGVPARYVSGYLAADEGPSLSDASHAWVQLWHDGAWHGFDPANHVRQNERYVVTAVGRDYDDVAPMRGTFRGSAVEDWRATVRVVSQGQEQSQQQASGGMQSQSQG